MVGHDAPASPARGVAGAAALLALLVAVTFADVLFAGRTLSPSFWVPGVLPSGPVGAPTDVPLRALRDPEGGAWVDEPAPYLLHRPLASGRLPLWNPSVALGAPLAANPNMAAWSPLQMPVNLRPTPLVQDIFWVARVWVLALATWALARAIGLGFVASLAAAAALALSGQTLDWLVHHPLNTDAFVPAALAAGAWVLRGSRRARVVLVLATAAALLGVKPQSALTGAAFGALLLIAMLADERRDRAGADVRRLPAVVLAVAIGVVLAALALVPFVESHGAASGLVRAGRSTQSEWTRPLATIGGLAGPWALRLTAGPDAAPLDGPPRAGLTVLLLAAIGVWRARRRAVAWVLAATIALYVARIFGLLPLSLAGVPVLGDVSYVKYCFPLYLALALAAGLALDPRAAARAGGAAHTGVVGSARRRWTRVVPIAGALAITAELLWLGMVPRPPRLDPYRPAPWVERLRALQDGAPGRITGPVALAPPLVSAVLGFRDLRAIDVLTPALGYDFVAQLVAPSEGITWILADPDPLTAATAPGAAVSDLRWILARDDLDPSRLPAVVRSASAALRLQRLFSTLTGYRIDTAELGGGITERDGDRRFHWTCRTPCRFAFELERAPRAFAAGIASPEDARLDLRLTVRDGARERSSTATLDTTADARWHDLWIDATSDADAASRKAGGVTAVRSAGSVTTIVELAIDAPTPTTVFVGGIGPSPGRAAERATAERELEFRTQARVRLVLRDADPVARIFENPAALGEAYLASDVVAARDLDEVRSCLLAHPGRAVACVADPAALPPADGTSPGTVQIERSDDAGLEATVDVSRPALLVVSRLDADGWRATVDGTETALVRVHGAMMGIVVPRGRHQVVLAYRPRSLFAGAVLSLAGLVALVLWVRFEGVRGRR